MINNSSFFQSECIYFGHSQQRHQNGFSWIYFKEFRWESGLFFQCPKPEPESQSILTKFKKQTAPAKEENPAKGAFNESQARRHLQTKGTARCTRRNLYFYPGASLLLKKVCLGKSEHPPSLQWQPHVPWSFFFKRDNGRPIWVHREDSFKKRDFLRKLNTSIHRKMP